MEDNDMPADREAWFKAVELAYRGADASGRAWPSVAAYMDHVANMARDLYVLLTTGHTAYERP